MGYAKILDPFISFRFSISLSGSSPAGLFVGEANMKSKQLEPRKKSPCASILYRPGFALVLGLIVLGCSALLAPLEASSLSSVKISSVRTSSSPPVERTPAAVTASGPRFNGNALFRFSTSDLDLTKPAPARQSHLSNYGKLPMRFELNSGQTDDQVKFMARGSGYALFLTASEAVFVLRKAEKNAQDGQLKGLSEGERLEKSDLESSSQNSQLESVVRMKLVGANESPDIAGLEQLPGKVNYFIGNDPKKWRTNIPTYAKVEHRGVYPGINLVYYGNQRQVEYDFIVSPGSDPSAIQIAYEGTDKIEVDSQGDLIVRTASGDLRMHKPLTYQIMDGVRREIPVSYVISPRAETADSDSRIVGFEIASYDTNKPLIIDPVLVYSTYFGGNDQDTPYGIAVDSSGNAYVAGTTASTDFPTANPLQGTLRGDYEAFVAKLNATGSALLSSTPLISGETGSTLPTVLPWTPPATLTLRVLPTQPTFRQ